MYEDKEEVSIRIVAFNPKEETTITYQKEDEYLYIDDVHGPNAVTFKVTKDSLKRIVDMLNYVIKINQDGN